VLVVRDGEGEAMRERLLPFVAQVVSEVDVPKRLIRVVWEADW
jgi:ribosomal 30S subunit maturation factor RimM